jgi:hypothetical protein
VHLQTTGIGTNEDRNLKGNKRTEWTHCSGHLGIYVTWICGFRFQS